MNEFDDSNDLERSVRAGLWGCVAAVAFLAVVAALGPLEMTPFDHGTSVHMALQSAVPSAAAADRGATPSTAEGNNIATFHGASFATGVGSVPDPLPQD